MKFCPECGGILNGKKICDCGYNTETGIREEKCVAMEEIDIEKIIKENAIPLSELKKKENVAKDVYSIHYFRGGGMMGGGYSLSLNFDNKTLEEKSKAWHHSPMVIKRYTVSDELIKKIRKIIEENNMPAWSEVAINKELIAFDAPTSNIDMCTNDKNYRISTLIYMDEEERKVYEEFFGLINSIINEANLISSEEVEDNISFANPMGNVLCPKCGKPIMGMNLTCSCGYSFLQDQHFEA